MSSDLKGGGIKAPKKQALSDTESDDLLKAVKNPRAHLFLRVGLDTGMRRGEILALGWENIDFDSDTIYVCQNALVGDGKTEIVPYTKTDAGVRKLGMSPTLKEELMAYRKTSRSKLVFAMKNGKPLSKSAFRSLWRLIARELSGKHVTPHTLRRTFITRLVRKGVPMELIQYLAGHADERMVKKVYTDKEEAQLAEKAVDALLAFHKPPSV